MENIKDFLRLLQELQKIDSEFPLQYAVCFGVIALHEGLSISDLANKTNLGISTVSRIVGALSSTRQKGVAYGLISVNISATEKRKKEIFLTTKGHKFIKNLNALIEAQQSTAKTSNRIARAV